MKKSFLLIGAILFTITTIFAQDIEKKWQFEDITNQNNESLFNIHPEADTLSLTAGEFNFTLNAKNRLSRFRHWPVDFLRLSTVAFEAVNWHYFILPSIRFSESFMSVYC